MWSVMPPGTGATAAWSLPSLVWPDCCGSTWCGSLVLVVGTCPKTIIPWPERCWCWSCAEPRCAVPDAWHTLSPSAMCVCSAQALRKPSSAASPSLFFLTLDKHFSASFSLQLVSGSFLLSSHSLMESRNKDQGRHRERVAGVSVWHVKPLTLLPALLTAEAHEAGMRDG